MKNSCFSCGAMTITVLLALFASYDMVGVKSLARETRPS